MATNTDKTSGIDREKIREETRALAFDEIDRLAAEEVSISKTKRIGGEGVVLDREKIREEVRDEAFSQIDRLTREILASDESLLHRKPTEAEAPQPTAVEEPPKKWLTDKDVSRAKNFPELYRIIEAGDGIAGKNFSYSPAQLSELCSDTFGKFFTWWDTAQDKEDLEFIWDSSAITLFDGWADEVPFSAGLRAKVFELIQNVVWLALRERRRRTEKEAAAVGARGPEPVKSPRPEPVPLAEPPAPEKTLEELGRKLNEAREAFIEAYRVHYRDKKPRLSLIRRALGLGMKVKEEVLDPQLREAREKYNEVKLAFGQKLWADKKKESGVEGVLDIDIGREVNWWDGQRRAVSEAEAELLRYRYGLFDQLIVKEKDIFHQALIESYPPIEKGRLRKGLE